eukprot:6571180-Prymnesium_polylepis.1
MRALLHPCAVRAAERCRAAASCGAVLHAGLPQKLRRGITCTMRLVMQRVTQASVTVDGEVVGQIGRGLLVLVGITDGDDDAAADWCCRRLLGTRLWEDDAGKAWAKSVQSAGYELLLVSQFTLCARARPHTQRASHHRSSRPPLHPQTHAPPGRPRADGVLKGNKPDFHHAMAPGPAKV